MFALCDANSMYASCEKVFDPSIRNKPVVVLTNNDGCICAACGIAKRMGVGKKFVPYFQVKKELEAAGVVIRSSNYELYADLSQRMMDTCARFAPDINVYSIDECFLYYGKDATAPQDGWNNLANSIRKTVWREVRLPICVGIGPTPTLAKVANHAAKNVSGFIGVAVLDNEDARKHVLKQLAVTDVWGIGKRLGVKLNALGIHTAWELANRDPSHIRKAFSIIVENTVRELNGEIRHCWETVRGAKKEIYSTRSFGSRVTDYDELRAALAGHAETVSVKLRKQKSVTSSMTLFATNSPHDNGGYVRRSFFHRFTVPTNDTRNILHVIDSAMSQLFQPGVHYYKCGVGLMDLHEQDLYQYDLFNPSNDNSRLMACMDNINSRYGRSTVQMAAKGFEQRFSMKRAFLSPQYTTQWRDIPKIKC
ncbi:DNA-directed DNA polymerase [Paraglaciecola sp. T6c]|uniref:Y-family DNA polymerase n=1 Tax=Pseudoalteromonas atlantica (strain T6c / ATCC BAA-1087) TaxID=3042615 RepID=UPI00005C6312|nr:Y-family DNA polymerase [Paraglaciecola sp. T6c]ABG40861.1 DNA-directed DNA polymerase [Paraglaciecola sp. T6c]